MNKKVFSVVILMIIILSSVIIPKIYADNNEIVGVPNANVKVGEQVNVYLNLENITEYTLSKIVLTTDIYIEPELDVGTTGLTAGDMIYDAQKKEFTITNLDGIKALLVTYTIPQYIASGTKIKLTIITYGYKGTEIELAEQYKKTYEIVVIGEEPNIPSTPNNNDNKTPNDNGNNNTTNPNNTRKYV